MTVGKKQRIFAQGDAADAIFYIQKGRVKLTVVSKTGKEATIALLGEGSFFGEGSLAGQSLRMGSASATTDCRLLRIDRKAMMDVLHKEHAFSDMFVSYLLARNICYEEDPVDHLFNSSEKRLARVLLMLARFGKEGTPEIVVPKISQETLAEMVGTTRSRVSFFMNRFRKLGFINLCWRSGRRPTGPQLPAECSSSALIRGFPSQEYIPIRCSLLAQMPGFSHEKRETSE
jgi:CRP/FNR family transcriptional regulator, cyclic AMP receptor protein